MSAVIRSTTRGRQPYVHKLRLEARDGASVHIEPATPLADAGPRMLAKLIGAVIAGIALLLIGGKAVL